jgi:hypothetical protein
VPKLRLAHSEETIRANSSLDYWERQSTQNIVDSLRPGERFPLIVGPDGAIMNGNTRVYVLQQRGYDVDTLPSEPYQREEYQHD